MCHVVGEGRGDIIKVMAYNEECVYVAAVGAFLCGDRWWYFSCVVLLLACGMWLLLYSFGGNPHVSPAFLFVSICCVVLRWMHVNVTGASGNYIREIDLYPIYVCGCICIPVVVCACLCITSKTVERCETVFF